MEENRNDPLTFIGFLLISIIIMFWYYSNQSIPAIVENDAEIIENTISEAVSYTHLTLPTNREV